MGFRSLGQVDFRQRGPQSGFGFAEARRNSALNALQGRTTEEDQAAVDLRNRLSQNILDRLSQVQARPERTQADVDALIQKQNQQFSADSQRGLANALAQARRQLAGTGLAGTSQFGRSLGSIVGESTRSQQRGLLDLLQSQQQARRAEEQLNLQTRLGNFQEFAGLQGLQNNLTDQAFRERQFLFQQGGALANLLNQQADSELQRQSALRSAGQGGVNRPTFFEGLAPSLLSAGGSIAGSYFGGKAAGAGFRAGRAG